MEASLIHTPALAARRRSDEQLVASFRNGDEDAFAAIHERYRVQLVHYARKLLGAGQSEAEDVIQDVFWRASRALLRDNRPVAVRGWLYSVAHNRCIDEIRRPQLPVAEVYELSRQPVSDPPSCAERREDLDCVVRDMRRLPDQQRAAVVMSAWEGVPYTEIAERLDSTVPGVKSALNRARTTLSEAGEARNARCPEIRAELAAAQARHARMSGRSRKHMLDCAACDHFHKRLHGHDVNAAAPGHGLIAAIAKLLGFGAGGGATAVGGGGAAGAVAGANAVGGGVLAAKVVAMVSAAAVAGAGAAVELDRDRAAPPSRHVGAPLTRAHRTVATDSGGVLSPSVVSTVRPVRGVPASPRPAGHVVVEAVPSTPGGAPFPRTITVTRRVTVPAARTTITIRPRETGGMLAPDEPAPSSPASTSAPSPPPPSAEYEPPTELPPRSEQPSTPTEPKLEQPASASPASEAATSDADPRPDEPETAVGEEPPALLAEPSAPSSSGPSDDTTESETYGDDRLHGSTGPRARSSKRGREGRQGYRAQMGSER